MSGHYYSEKPSSSGKRTIIKSRQLGNLLTFKSQSGVFSWSEIDKGSEILLNHLLVPNSKPRRILDLGCGYGFLGISLAKAYPAHKVVLVDINELAVKLTKDNCRTNNVEQNTRVKKSYLFDSFKEEKFDLIVTNPPLMAGKIVLTKLIGDSINYLAKNGSIQLVVPKKKGLLSLQKMLEATYEDVSVLGRKSGYWVLMGKNK